ncbi:hypothetical protein [Microtetraspora malaysiensis]|uniref:hypothetical protein n=1 Tax=Microtetraspora malaysiensis TaxID=161358 RepID=UPI000B2F0C61|nr:hypothetical protein [Microtetraspora malaysiensis]
MVPFLASMALGLLRRPYSFVVFAAVIVAEFPVALLLGDAPPAALYTALLVVVVALPLYGLTRFAETARTLYETRAELVAAEVDGQRVRIAGELQALLGERLDDIGTRGARALAQVDGDPERLREELSGMLTLARDVQREMRDFAHREQMSESGTDDYPK